MRAGRADGEHWLRLGEAADELGVSLNTLRRWSDANRLTCYRSPGGHRRYRRSDVDRLLREQTGSDEDGTAVAPAFPAVAVPSAALSALARVAADSIGAAGCRILLRGRGDDVTLGGSFHRDGGKVDEPGDAWVAGEVSRSGRRVVIGDLEASFLLPPPTADAYRSSGTAALLALPLDGGGDVTGVMELTSSERRTFTGPEIAVAGFFAREAAALVGGGATTISDGLTAVLPQAPPVVAAPRNEVDVATDDGAGAGRRRDMAPDPAPWVEDVTGLSTRDVLRSVAQRLSEQTGAPVVDIYTVEGDTLRALLSYDGGRFDEEWEDVAIPLVRYPCSLRAVESGELTVVSSLADPLLETGGRYSLEKWGYQAQLTLPLMAAGHVAGIVELSDYVPRDFGPDLEVIRRLGAVASRALENDRLIEQAERRGRILSELVELGALAGGSRDSDELLRHVAERLLEAVDAADCDIYRVTDEGLHCAVSCDRSGFDDQQVGRILDPSRYPSLTKTMGAHQVLVIDGPDDPQLTEREHDLYREFGVLSEVAIPLVANDRLCGVIDLYDTRRRDYTEYLGFLRSAGQTLAAALQNADLFDQLQQRTTVLREIVELGAVTSQTHDLQELLRAVAARLRDTVRAADCDIFTLQGEQLRCLVSADLNGFDEGVVGDLLDVSRFPATEMAVHTGEPMTISSLEDPRLSDYERENYAAYGFQSELCIPLVVGDRVIGLIDLFDTRPRDYETFIDYLRSVGQTVAGAIENALLVEALERRNEALAELVALGRLVSGRPDLDALVRAAGPRLVEVVGAAGCQIFAARGGQLHCLLTYENGEFEESNTGWQLDLQRFPSTRDALERREVLVIASPDDPRLSDYERELYRESGSASEICVPLTVEERLVGLLDVYDRRSRDYGDYRDFLVNAAQTLAEAFENVLQVEQLERGNEMLRRAADRMALVTDVSYELSSSLHLDEVLRSTAERLCTVADVPECDIYTLQGDILVNVVSLQDGEIDADWQGRSFPLAGWAALKKAVDTRETVSIESLDDPLLLPAERTLMEEYGETSEIAVPLISKERVIGVLELLDRRPRRFSPEELATISAVCRVAALAIDNADLVEDLQLRNRENELLNEIAGAMSASLDLQDIAAAAVDKLRRIVPFDGAFVALRGEGDSFHLVHTSPPAPAAPASLTPPQVAGLLSRLTGRRMVVLDLPEELPSGLELPGLGGLNSGALVALTKGAELVGILGLGARAPGAFAAVDRRLLERTGTHLALAIDNARMYDDIKHLHLNNLKALSSALNAKDYYTVGHAARVAAYMVLLGEELGWSADRLRHIEEAAYLHDIGKIGVSDRVLLKPSSLNQREWELMRLHPVFSADIIRSLFADDLVLGVRHHHERFEGGGYPDGLAGDDIPLIARAMCVADSYDAMSFRRPYRLGLSYDDCIKELRRCRGTQFDPTMADAFIRVLERLTDRRRRARDVAQEAAGRVDAEEHAHLRDPEDADSPEYQHILRTFREVCAANPPTRYITSHMRVGKKTVVVVDSGEDGPDKPKIGDEMLTDDELIEVFAGRDLDANVLFVDQWGVWVSGSAPVLDQDGRVVAVVTADLPATGQAAEAEGMRSNVAQTFASMLHTAAVQAGRTEIEAITDGLTGLYNHRYFHERLSEEVDRCLSQEGRVTLLFCDIDNFRAFNELHGHSAGDQALRAVARVIETSIRHVDIAARFGGEEFAAILIDTDETGAAEVAERIRTGILDARVAAADTLSISIGIASCPSDATFKEELIDKADWAMYLAKRRGRDQVMSFSAQHGTATPEQAASVTGTYVTAMSELVAARTAYERRKRFAVAHLAKAVATELGLDARDVVAMASAAETGATQTLTGVRQTIVEAAEAYQALVAERPYREQLSEAEALDELLACPALRDDHGLADAFERVLSGEVRQRRS